MIALPRVVRVYVQVRFLVQRHNASVSELGDAKVTTHMLQVEAVERMQQSGAALLGVRQCRAWRRAVQRGARMCVVV